MYFLPKLSNGISAYLSSLLHIPPRYPFPSSPSKVAIILTFVFFMSLQFLRVLARVHVSLSSKMFDKDKVSSKLKSSCVRKGNTATIRNPAVWGKEILPLSERSVQKKPVSLISASDNLQEPLLRKSVGKVTSPRKLRAHPSVDTWQGLSTDQI